MYRNIEQGDVLSIEKISVPILVVSKNFFNQTEQIIGCPIYKNSSPDPLHIYLQSDNIQGYVLCEQLKLLDLRVRGYKKICEIKMDDIMNISDTIQGIFDYYPYR